MNELKVATQKAIIALALRGWSFRRIAQELGIHRETVARYVRLASEAASKPAISTAGSDGKPAIPTPGSAGRPSQCEPHRDRILGKLADGLSAQRIWQDLCEDHEFEGSYESVKRFVRPLRDTTPLPFRRLECDPGEEAQVDFGKAAPIEGRRSRPHLFRVVLSHSRKGYSEVIERQTTEAFIRCLENAFWHFGGVPRTLVIDNLRAAVKRADWFDPELNPKIESFCRHYGTTILPTKPYTPRHKGKVESGVDYVQQNALKARRFPTIDAENTFLGDWEARVADTRIHGTTREQVRRRFETGERPALLPLPTDRFPFFHEGQRRVHRDGHIEVDRAYYSVPPEYLGRRLWVRWDVRVVRVFNFRLEQVAVHAKHAPGRFSTDPVHIASRKRSAVERGASDLIKQARRIGPETGRWAEAMHGHRGIQGIRVLVGLLSLARRHRVHEIERACRSANEHGAFRLRAIRELIKRQVPEQPTLEFCDSHPIIRELVVYGDITRGPKNQEEDR